MAGKAWCCGGSSGNGGGGGGGLAAVTTADTATVDLSGDGTSGAPLSAAVLVAPEPNGLEAAAGGLLVAPSADAGNTLAVGSDGRLFVPPASGGSTDVVGAAGSDPAPVSASRSVDVDVTESPAGTFTVGARLSPVWADITTGMGTMDETVAPNGSMQETIPGATLTIPEDGVYEVTAQANAQVIANVATGTTDALAAVTLFVNGAGVTTAYAAQWQGATPAATAGSGHMTTRRQFSAGDVVEMRVSLVNGTAATADVRFLVTPTGMGYVKITD
ncbi:MAG TPA: hypothetical protein VK545_26555 [Streptomyces sp.]|nr:hypothetical protein [Streptomyces sp.]